jgi:hypothetical protein
MTVTRSASKVTVRGGFGLARVIAGALLLAAITTQVVDELAHDAFAPATYFSYFTIQSSLMSMVTLVVGGIFALRTRTDTTALTTVRVAVFAYAIVTGVIYNGMLRYLTYSGYHGIHWPTEVLHVVVPLFIVIDWILAPGRRPVAWRSLWFVMIYPAAWVIVTLVRGAIDGWYPYPFLDPANAGGYLSVAAYVVAIGLAFAGLGALAIAISRRRMRAAAN